MDLFVVGCHGGETLRHRTSAFVIDDRIAIDAGSLTSGLTLEAQCALETVLVSHAHLDHVRDLATIADNRSQNGSPPLNVCGTKATLSALKKHFFNNLLWPDFTRIPSEARPTIRLVTLKPEVKTAIGTRGSGVLVRPIPVSHTIDCAGFTVETKDGVLAYSGDTGPTDRFWEILNEEENLKALLLEVSFPNDKQRLADVSGHHTPNTLAADLKKYKNPKDLATLLYHIKPSFEAQVERECARLKGLNLTRLGIGDHFIL